MLNEEENKTINPIIRLADFMPTIMNGLNEDDMGLQTGISSLDNQIRGLKSTELIILAGRPSMGKSSFMIDAILNVSKTMPVVVFSVEMAAKVLIERMLANTSKINYTRLKSNMLLDTEKQRLNASENYLMTKEIYIDESSLITPMHIYKTIKSITAETKIGCVFIDYLQLMNMHKAVENRNQELSVITRHIKAMAKGFNIPFVLLSQLNRSVEYRENNRPRLSDLRDSGAIEQDADIVLLLHRPSYYSMVHNPSACDSGQAEIIIAKNRNGPVGVVKCIWDGKIMSFSEGVNLGDF